MESQGPGPCLEREDYGEPRFRVIREVLQDILVVVYTLQGSVCRLIITWEAENWELDLWYEQSS